MASSHAAPAYCIHLPPPNVSAPLYTGRAFQRTLMDALVRYHRMRGCNANWVVGTDHAGIATQIVVERQLEAEGKTRHTLRREKAAARGAAQPRPRHGPCDCCRAGRAVGVAAGLDAPSPARLGNLLAPEVVARL